MTIASEIAAVNYAGNGIQTVFTYNFLIPRKSDNSPAVTVWKQSSTGVITQVPSSSYIITGTGNPAGGAIQYPIGGPPPLAANERIGIFRGSLYVQLTSVANQAFYPKTLEQVADYITYTTQQLYERTRRSLQGPVTEGAIGLLPTVDVRKNKYLGFDNLGNPVALAGGGGGGGSDDWNALSNIPGSIQAVAGLTPSAGEIVVYTSSSTAMLIPVPSGAVASVNGDIGVVVLDYADVGAAPTVHTHTYNQVTNFGAGVFDALVAGTNITLSFNAGTGETTINASGGSGNMRPALLSDFGAVDPSGATTGANDAAIAAAQAAGNNVAIYLDDGIYKKSYSGILGSALTKGYEGRGIFIEDVGAGVLHALPAKFSYMATKPTTWPTQGLTGWFRGDQRFTNGGAYKVIGPDVREYDTTSRYFESNTIPDHAWFDVNSGNSGINAYATNTGFTIAMGVNLPVRGNPPAAWVGKTIGFSSTVGGAITDTKTVVSVGVNTIQINSALANNYAWNPAAGLTPNFRTGSRTWNGYEYRKIAANAGGDVYGVIWRTVNSYAKKATEYHTFMTATAGLCGGDQYLNAAGLYQTGFENFQSDKPSATAYEGASIQFVSSHARHVDTELSGGRMWFHGLFKQEGTRPTDAGITMLGMHRRGLDVVGAPMTETATLFDPTASSGAAIKVFDTTRQFIVIGDPVEIGEPGALLYTGTITGGSGGDAQVITVSPNLPVASIPAGTHVRFPRSGAALHLANYQKIVFGGGIDALSGRTGDTTGAYPAFFGNVLGDTLMESGLDSTKYWSIRIANRLGSAALPDLVRLRLRDNGTSQWYSPNGITFTGNLGVNGDISVSAAGQRLVLATGVWVVYDGVNAKITKNNGGSYTILV